MSRAGGASPLEVNIWQKQFRSASGEGLAVLERVSFRLEPGETGAIVGPSGCGKTTLLRIVAGLDADFSGDVTPPPDHAMGFVFQEPRLLAWRSVYDNVTLAAPRASQSEIEALFEMLGLSAHRNLYPGELSGGLARRVSLARAFAVRPSLLLLDEPFVSLDAALAAHLRAELSTLLERCPATTLLVTHDMEEAITLADRIFILSPRPARVLGEVRISAPRGQRSGAERECARREISFFADAA